MVEEKTLEYYKELDKKTSWIPLTFDKHFKAVFLKNKDILKEFLILQLNLNLDIEKAELTISNVELPSDMKREYQKTVDILVYVNDEIITNIEANRSLYKDVKLRNCVYFGKLYGTSIKEGESPKIIEDRQIIQLNINGNKLDNKNGGDIYEIRSKITNEPLIENFQIYTKNIAFYREEYYNKREKLTKSELWLVALSSKSLSELYEIISQVLDKEKVERFMESVVIMLNEEMILKDWERKKLDELVEYQTMKRITTESTERGLKKGLKQGLKQGIEQGIEQGLKTGEKNKQLEIAKNLLNLKIETNDIIKATGLTKKEIENLK